MDTTLKEGLPLKVVKKQGDAVSAAGVCGYKSGGSSWNYLNLASKLFSGGGGGPRQWRYTLRLHLHNFVYAMLFYLLALYSYVFFQGCPCPLLDVIDVLHPGAPPSSVPRHHSENACLYNMTLIISACMSKGIHFSFDNLGKEFASCFKFIQNALVCPFLHPTYPQHSSVAPHFSC